MLNKFFFLKIILIIILVNGQAAYSVTCGGRFPNLVKDICWNCLFPMQIGPIKINPANQSKNYDPQPLTICKCPMSAPPYVRFGIGLSYWEPARIAEVVRTPFCSPTIDGKVLGILPVPAGTHGNDESENSMAFYHVHWIQFPVINWLGMLFSKLCFVREPFDVAYMSELDPLWDDDELTFILNPEAVLFTHPIVQAACAADSIAASIKNFGLDVLFWCSGSQGSLYPLSGSHAGHVGGVDSSLAMVHKMIFKMHRQLLAQDTSTPVAMCGGVPQPILRKTQYKQQMMYPISQTLKGYGIGTPSTLWGAGREFPYKGEDFSYMVWRKRLCCAL